MLGIHAWNTARSCITGLGVRLRKVRTPRQYGEPFVKPQYQNFHSWFSASFISAIIAIAITIITTTNATAAAAITTTTFISTTTILIKLLLLLLTLLLLLLLLVRMIIIILLLLIFFFCADCSQRTNAADPCIIHQRIMATFLFMKLWQW